MIRSSLGESPHVEYNVLFVSLVSTLFVVLLMRMLV